MRCLPHLCACIHVFMHVRVRAPPIYIRGRFFFFRKETDPAVERYLAPLGLHSSQQNYHKHAPIFALFIEFPAQIYFPYFVFSLLIPIFDPLRPAFICVFCCDYIRFKLAPHFNETELAHMLLPREGVVSSFVVLHEKTSEVKDWGARKMNRAK